jgi:hypothetical protein
MIVTVFTRILVTHTGRQEYLKYILLFYQTMTKFNQYSIRWSAQTAIRPIAGAIVLLLLSSTLLTNLVSAQVFPKSQAAAPIGSNKSISTLSLTKHPKAHNVKIISPTKGEKVPVGKNLVISGTSAGNSNYTSINCQVSVIVNGIKPYRPATASGLSGSGDYSKWSFSLAPNQTAIKAGQNKITAKYSCANNAAALSHNSVNVTGITTPSVNATAK